MEILIFIKRHVKGKERNVTVQYLFIYYFCMTLMYHRTTQTIMTFNAGGFDISVPISSGFLYNLIFIFLFFKYKTKT